MATINRPQFVYNSLYDAEGFGVVSNCGKFRLIHLHPSPDIEAQLECTMETARLIDYDSDFINQYIALSYVWGHSIERQEIIIDGCRFAISASLESTLRNIRHPKGTIRLWVDAICINQRDNHERADQVSIMGAIYRVATRTIIYLGDSNEEVASAFAAIPFLIKTGSSSIDPSLPATDDERRLNLLRIWKDQVLTRPWFSRVWVFQELLLSKDPWIQCGPHRLHWFSLCIAFREFQRDSKRLGVNISVEGMGLEDSGAEITPLIDQLNVSRNKVQGYQLLRESHENGDHSGLTMLDTLLLRRGLGVTDPRDMIYGHLGIAFDFQNDDLINPQMQANYDISYHDVLISTTKAIIENSKRIAILRYTEGLKIPGLPSWVTDWSKGSRYKGLDYPEMSHTVHTVDEHRERIFAALKTHSLQFDLSGNSNHHLKVTGYPIGRVREVGSIILRLQDIPMSASQLNSLRSVLLGWKDRCNPGRIIRLANNDVIFEECEPKHQTCCATQTGLQNSIELRAALKELLDSLYGTVPEAALDPLFVIAILAFRGSRRDEDTRARTTYTYSKLGKHNLQAIEIFLLKDELKFLDGRRMCILSRKEDTSVSSYTFAVMPAETQVDDVVYYLPGETIPFVLRRVSPPNTYELIGICYAWFDFKFLEETDVEELILV
jgi:hypothetical protein